MTSFFENNNDEIAKERTEILFYSEDLNSARKIGNSIDNLDKICNTSPCLFYTGNERCQEPVNWNPKKIGTITKGLVPDETYRLYVKRKVPSLKSEPIYENQQQIDMLKTSMEDIIPMSLEGEERVSR